MTMMMTMVKASDDSGTAPRRAPQDTTSISRCEQTVGIIPRLFRLLFSSGGVLTPFFYLGRSFPARRSRSKIHQRPTFLLFPLPIRIKMDNPAKHVSRSRFIGVVSNDYCHG